MRLKYLLVSVCFCLVSQVSLAQSPSPFPATKIMDHIDALASENGIGPRVGGSKQEVEAATYVFKQLKQAGLNTEIQPFNAVFRGKKTAEDSQNVVAVIPGHSTRTFIIGAHYDSVPEATGSMGVIDNAASIALMIELARQIKKHPTPEITYKFIAFGAEEVGLIGAKEYVKTMSVKQRANTIGMLNLDSITGGDNLYIHSALNTGYECDDNTSSFAASPVYRDKLLVLSKSLGLSFAKHPGNPAYPPGETGGWSDHAPFACAGIPIANIEATNFSLLGRNGKDGYSQTANSDLWSCFNRQTKGACNKDEEKKWGEIWHTQYDRLDVLNKAFPDRLQNQLQQSFELLLAFTTNDGIISQAKEKVKSE